MTDREVLELLRANAPELCFHPKERHFPTSVEALVEGETEPRSVTHLRRFLGRPIAASNREPFLTLEMLDDEPHYAETGIPAEPRDYLDGSADGEARSEPFVAYARVVEGIDHLWVQYWMFYYDNPHWLLGDHQGDWELVQLRLASAGAIESATCFQHGKPEARDRDELDLTPDGRLQLFVARGSHATYFTADDPRPFDHLSSEGPRAVLDPRLLDEQRDSWLGWPGRWGRTHWGPFLSRSPKGPAQSRLEWDDPEAAHQRGRQRRADRKITAPSPPAPLPDPRPFRHQVLEEGAIELLARRADGSNLEDLHTALERLDLEEFSLQPLRGVDDVFRVLARTGDPEQDRLTASSFELSRQLRGLGWEVEPDLRTTVFRPSRDDFGVDPAEAEAKHWAVETIRAPEAWRLATGEGIRVGHPDTGFVNHPELKGAIDVRGAFDLVSGDADPTDELEGFPPIFFPGHGTGTASVIASRRSPDRELWGAAPAASVVPFRVCRSVVLLRGSQLLEAIGMSRKAGCRVISISLGGLFLGSALRAAIEETVSSGVIVVAAAGQPFPFVVEPASYEASIAVAATTSAEEPWRLTARGQSVDIAAPGVAVPRASAKGMDVARGDGTSFSTGLVAGVAALWVEAHGTGVADEDPALVAPTFRAALAAGARRPAGWDSQRFGAGIVDARALLEASGETSPPSAAAAGREDRLVDWLSRIVGVDMKPWLKQRFGERFRQDVIEYGTELAYLAAEDELARIQLWQAAEVAAGQESFELIGAPSSLRASSTPRLTGVASPSLRAALDS